MFALMGCAGPSAQPVIASSGSKPMVGSTTKPPLTGSGVIRISTDASGRVVSAVRVKPIHPDLDETAVSWALAHWRGPPHSTKDVPLTFVLNDGKPQISNPPAGVSSR